MPAPGTCHWPGISCRVSLSHVGVRSGVPLWAQYLVVSALLHLWAGAGVALCGGLALPSQCAAWWGAGWSGAVTVLSFGGSGCQVSLDCVDPFFVHGPLSG
ncbi:hypothetical protein AMECASPLE_028562 [Ameca splendens]|uniref:Uncharacterized protein n=1 Tax=Ameca splendens TaxID=208324 RepID=A0ABV0ZFB1_9TELE